MAWPAIAAMAAMTILPMIMGGKPQAGGKQPGPDITGALLRGGQLGGEDQDTGFMSGSPESAMLAASDNFKQPQEMNPSLQNALRYRPGQLRPP